MESRKFHKAKQEMLTPINHITQKRNLDSPKLCLATKSSPASMNRSKKYPWLDHDVTSDSVKCYFCKHQKSLGALKAERSKEDTFLVGIRNNWKKTLSKFDKHQRSHYH